MPTLFRFGPYVLDTEQKVLLLNDQVVALSPKALETLELLVTAQGRILLRADFMQALWPATFVEEGNLTQNIFVLRRTLGLTETAKSYIETVPKRGYRFTVPVQIVDQPVKSLQSEVPTGPVEALGGRDPVDRRGSASEPRSNHDAASFASVPGPSVARRESSVWWPRFLVAFAVALVASWAFLSHDRAPESELREVGARRLTNDGIPKDLGPFPTAMTTDGQRLYFTERRGNLSYLADVALEGGITHAQLPPFPGAVTADYSRRLSKLLIGSVWQDEENRPILSRDSKGEIQLLGPLKGHDATFSPDGRQIAFSQGNTLQVARADGSGAHLLAAGDGVIYWPRWSPDGRRLRFSENYGANRTRLWEVDASGGPLKQVLGSDANRDHVCCGMWSDDGRWFIYLVSAPNASSIWVLPEKRSWRSEQPQPKQVVPSNDIEWRAPFVNADGTKLWAIGSDSRAELFRINPTTRDPEPYLGGLSAEGVSFSPDNSAIAYTAYPEGTLWISRANGAGARKLTSRPMVARFPRWSPDGRTIVFLGGQASSNWQLYVVDTTSGSFKPMLQEDQSEGVASWSPDGRQILFGRLPRHLSEQDPKLNLHIYDLQRKALTQIEGSESLWTPRWSPNGRYIVAVTEDNRSLRLYDVQRQTWSHLADVGANDIVWTPDSRYIFFDTVLGAPPLLYRMRIADMQIEKWADLRDFQRGGLFSPWLGLAADGQPILLKDRTIEEVYEFDLQESPGHS